MTAAWLLLTFGACGITGFIYYWAGVDSEAQRVKDDRRELAILRERYELLRELNVDLAHQVSTLRLRERFAQVVEDGWR